MGLLIRTPSALTCVRVLWEYGSEIGYRGSGCGCRVSASKSAQRDPPGIMRVAFENTSTSLNGLLDSI